MTKPDEHSEEYKDATVQRLESGIEQTRADMSATIDALETRLSPERVGIELKRVEEHVRDVVRDQLVDAKQLVKEELLEAKNLLRGEVDNAEEKIKRGLGEARDAVKNDIKEAITGAKHAVRAATLGKVEDLATNIGDKMNETRDTLVDTVRNNPVPAGLVGIGLVWLLMNRSRSKQERGSASNGPSLGAQGLLQPVEAALSSAGSRVGRAAHQVGDAASSAWRQTADAASGAVEGVSDKASSLAHDASDAASHLYEQATDVAATVADSTKRGARSVEQGFKTQLQENPIAIGAAALAIGAVVGFSLPRSEREDSLMGEARDRLLHDAGDMAHDAARSAAQLAERAVESAKGTGADASSAA